MYLIIGINLRNAKNNTESVCGLVYKVIAEENTVHTIDNCNIKYLHSIFIPKFQFGDTKNLNVISDINTEHFNKLIDDFNNVYSLKSSDEYRAFIGNFYCTCFLNSRLYFTITYYDNNRSEFDIININESKIPESKDIDTIVIELKEMCNKIDSIINDKVKDIKTGKELIDHFNSVCGNNHYHFAFKYSLSELWRK